jgi:hypothetical protein
MVVVRRLAPLRTRFSFPDWRDLYHVLCESEVDRAAEVAHPLHEMVTPNSPEKAWSISPRRFAAAICPRYNF